MTETNLLPSFCTARVLVLGVGNMMFSDDGFGPAVIEYLQDRYQIPEDIYVMDTGTGVRKVLFTLALGETHPQEVVIVDAVDWGQTVGQVIEITADQLPASKIDDFSLHQVPTSNLLHDLQNICAVKVSVIACDVGEIPQEIGPGLTPKIQLAVAAAAQQIASKFGLEGKRHA